MSLPDKCPFCGAGVSATGDGSKRSERWVSFDCFTQVFACDTHPTQSKSCNVSERSRLSARVAELEARCKRLEEAGDALERDKQTFKKILADLGVVGSMGFGSAVKWAQAKEANP